MKKIIKLKRKDLNEMVLKTVKKFLRENVADDNHPEYECINESNSWSEAMLKGSRGANGLAIMYRSSRNICEGIDWEVEEDLKGGIIVFSTDVNAVKKHENKVVNYINQKVSTIIDRINATKKIDHIAVHNNLAGWTVGRYLDGRYTAKNGKQYGENSLSVMIVGVSFNQLIKVAEELCASFGQESVLVKDSESNRILFVNPF